MTLTDKPDFGDEPDAVGWIGYTAPILAIVGAIAFYFGLRGAQADADAHARAVFWGGFAVAAGIAAIGIVLGTVGLLRGGHDVFGRAWIVAGIAGCGLVLATTACLLVLVSP